MQDVVSFSGGKDSTAMLLMMLEKNIKIDRVICIDTTKEFPAMYEHIKKVQKMILPLKIEIIRIDFDYWFGDHIKTKGKHKGKKGYGWPDFRNRWCTSLKQEAFVKIVNSEQYIPKKRNGIKCNKNNIIEFHGIAFDEKDRITKNHYRGRNFQYPLVDWHITEQQALEYCYSKGLTWGGLYEKMSRVSCWCCPLSRIGELRVLYNDFPELWKELKRMDKKSFRQFMKNYSVADLSKRFANENKQMTF